jgi:hypothetical protein
MAILKKGSRCIVIDGHNFRWRVRPRPTYSQGLCWSNLTLAVEAADASGSTLVVVLPQPHPSNWLQQLSSPVLPAQVADYVRQALHLGWQPTKPGKPFMLNQSQS